MRHQDPTRPVQGGEAAEVLLSAGVLPRFTLIAALFLMTLTACRTADGEMQTVVYGRAGGVPSEQLSLDVYRAPKANAPVVVYVHGGAWLTGDKGNDHGKAEFFARNGYLFVSANYRLAPHPPFPGNAQDVAAAVAWVRKHIGQYGGDPSRIYLLAHSAGAHLITLITTDGRYLARYGMKPSEIRAVALLDGAGYDIEAWMRHREGNEIGEKAFGNDPGLWREASPIRHVKRGGGTPPTLVVSIARSPIRAQWAKDYAAALQGAGVRTEYRETPGETHQSINRQFGQPEHAPTKVVMDFFRAH